MCTTVRESITKIVQITYLIFCCRGRCYHIILSGFCNHDGSASLSICHRLGICICYLFGACILLIRICTYSVPIAESLINRSALISLGPQIYAVVGLGAV